MPDTNLGTARGEVVIGADTKGADQAATALGKVDKASQDAERGVTKAGNVAGAAGLAIAAGIAVAVNSAANFEQRMSAVKAVSGATGAEMSKLSSLALQLGKDTAFSATDAASAIEELVKAGISVPDVMNGAAQATVALAAAGEVALPQAAELAANAMNAFNLSAQEMPKVADLIAGAANASAIDVSQFGQSLQQVGAVANLAGVSFDDTAAAIALLGNAGIKGSDAGTSLKTMFQNLIPTTEKQKDLFKELGLATEDGSNKFFDAQGNMKSLADVSQVLQNSLKGMSKEQKLATLETLFGSDAIRGAAILADEGAAGFDKMAKSMGKVTAEGVAAERMDNIKGSLEQLKGSLETAGIAVGTVLLPALRKLVDGLTSVLNKFLELSPETQKMILTSIAVAGGFLLFASAALKIGAAIKGLVGFIKLAGGAMKALNLIFAANPIGLIIIAIGLLVLGIILLWKRSETFRNIVLGVFNAVKTAAMAVANFFKGPFLDFFQAAWDGIKAGLSAVKDFFVSVWNGIKAAVSFVFAAIMAVIKFHIAVWTAIIKTGLAIIMAVWNTFWGLFGGIIKAAWDLIVAILKLGWVIIKGLFIVQMRALQALWSAVWGAIVAVATAVWNTIKGVITRGVNAVKSVLTAVWNAISNTNRAIWNGIKAAIAAVWAVIGPTVTRAVNSVKSAITSAWNTVKSITTSAWNGIKNAIRSAIDGFMSLVRGIQGRVTSALSGAASWLFNAGKNIIRGLIRGIESMIGAITGTVRNITNKIASALPGSPVEEGPLKVLNRGYAGKQIVKMIASGILDESKTLERAMRSLASNQIAGNLTPGPGASITAGNTLFSGADTAKSRNWSAGGISVENLEVKAYSDRFSLKQVQNELAMHGAV